MKYIETFQGYSNKIKSDLESFFNSHRIDIDKMKICQSESNGTINLTLIYEN